MIKTGWLWLLGYVVIYSALLFSTSSYPYVLDNNESYSSLWHARNLYAHGVAKSKGLTEEVFSPAAAAGPYIHSHQGNWPRFYTYLFYVLGARTVQSQIWISTFTVGLTGLIFAYLLLTRLASRLLATAACVVMMTNYLLFAQWQVSLYNVWHVFFFFSSLLCVDQLGRTQRPGRWAALTLLNFAAFFYWEYVFTTYAVVLCLLWGGYRYWRQPLRLLGLGAVLAGGAALAGGILLAQLTAYLGWENVRQDIHFTLTARNSAADPHLLEQVTSFYREHHIIFWHNFLDAAPLRNWTAFRSALENHHLKYYSTPLVTATLLLAGGYWLGSLGWLGGIKARVDAAARGHPAGAIIKWLGVTAGLGLLFQGSKDHSSVAWICWAGAAPVALFAGRCWYGSWWGWPRMGWRRLFGVAAYLLLLRAVLDWRTGLPSLADAGLRPATFSGLEPLLQWILLAGSAALGLSCTACGNAHVLGRSARRRWTPVLTLVGLSLVAYAATYVLFTGYVYSGYLHRQVPLLVFTTDLLLAAAVGVPLSALGWHSHRAALAAARTSGTPRAWVTAPALLTVLLLTLLLAAGIQWGRLQVAVVRAIPPDAYAFLNRLEQEPFRGHSFVTNTYPAPMAYRMHAWGYADTSIFSGMVTLNEHGFAMPHDPKYLWFADAATNPDYRRPDLALNVLELPNVDTALGDRPSANSAEPARIELAGLVQRAKQPIQPFLQLQLLYSDRHRIAAVRLDWDFPPFLQPHREYMSRLAARLTLEQQLSLSQVSQDLSRRWRVQIDPPRSATALTLQQADADDTPLFASTELAAAGWDRTVDATGHELWQSAPTSSLLTKVVMADRLHLSFSGETGREKFLLSVNDTRTELRAPAAGREEALSLDWVSHKPHGSYTRLPALSPGLYVQTFTTMGAGARFAEVRYNYAQQEGVPETATLIRLYRKSEDGQWSVADEFTFLGPQGIPLRLADFRRQNPGVLAEYRRVAAAGDQRTFLHWLSDHLTDHPTEWNRPGIVSQLVPRQGQPAGPGPGPARTRLIPLPADQAGTYQISVTPGTFTKEGPEYLGLVFRISDHDQPGRRFIENLDLPAIGSSLPFGLVKVRLRLPRGAAGNYEPLLTTGVNEAGDILYVVYVDDRHIRIGFDHWFVGGVLTGPIEVDYLQEHELQISMGSLFPEEGAIAFTNQPADFVQRAKHRLLLKLDGRTVIDTPADCYESTTQQVTVGRNEINGTSCGPIFHGEILSIQRVWPSSAW